MTANQLLHWLAARNEAAMALSSIPSEEANALHELTTVGKVVLWQHGTDHWVAITQMAAWKLNRHRSTISENDLAPGSRIADMPDPKASEPPDVADASERIERYERAASRREKRRSDYGPSADNLPRPSITLVGSRPWDSVIRRGPFCPTCWGKKLRPSVYCLRCDRWGLDHLIPARPKVQVKKVKAKFRPKGAKMG